MKSGEEKGKTNKQNDNNNKPTLCKLSDWRRCRGTGSATALTFYGVDRGFSRLLNFFCCCDLFIIFFFFLKPLPKLGQSGQYSYERSAG